MPSTWPSSAFGTVLPHAHSAPANAMASCAHGPLRPALPACRALACKGELLCARHQTSQVAASRVLPHSLNLGW
eukprot:3327911-Lingulodinium_polyedra.AAC.1